MTNTVRRPPTRGSYLLPEEWAYIEALEDVARAARDLTDKGLAWSDWHDRLNAELRRLPQLPERES